MSKKRIFENKQNGYRKEVGKAWLWCLLAGPFYLLYHGTWKHAAIHLILTGPALGLPWLIYPFFAEKVIADSYFERGWEEIIDQT